MGLGNESRFIDVQRFKGAGINVNSRKVLLEVEMIKTQRGTVAIRKASGDNVNVKVFVSMEPGIKVPPEASLSDNWSAYGWHSLSAKDASNVSGFAFIEFDNVYEKLAIQAVRTGSSTTTVDIFAVFTNRG